MSFALTPEQIEFQSTLRSFFQEHVTSAYLRSRFESSHPVDPKFSAAIAELGLVQYFGSQEEEERGGMRELFLVAFESGYALVPEGVSESLLSGPFLAGQLLAAKKGAYSEREEKLRTGALLSACTSSALISSCKIEAGKISGVADFVIINPSVETLVVADQASGHCYLTRVSSDCLEAQQCLDESVKRFRVRLSGREADKLPLSANEFLAYWHLTRAAEMAGACTRAVEMTAEFVKTRAQFDVPIGGFQAVQHALADMFVSAESLGALCRFAAWAGDCSREQFAFAANSALSYACETASPCIEKAIQLHGGIGFTWEYDLHFYLRRVKMLETLFTPDASAAKELLQLARAS